MLGKNEISIENFAKIFQSIKPKMDEGKFHHARQYRLDPAEVESTYCFALLGAISLWKKDKGACKFENFFWTRAKRLLSNKAMFDYVHPAAIQIDALFNPCLKCPNYKETKRCANLKNCLPFAHFKSYVRAKVFVNSHNSFEKDILSKLSESYHAKHVIQQFIKRHPESEWVLIEFEKAMQKKIVHNKIFNFVIKSVMEIKQCSFQRAYVVVSQVSKNLYKLFHSLK